LPLADQCLLAAARLIVFFVLFVIFLYILLFVFFFFLDLFVFFAYLLFVFYFFLFFTEVAGLSISSSRLLGACADRGSAPVWLRGLRRQPSRSRSRAEPWLLGSLTLMFSSGIPLVPFRSCQVLLQLSVLWSRDVVVSWCSCFTFTFATRHAND